jgi:RNA polymerase sigma-70 factor, ECF subfamily
MPMMAEVPQLSRSEPYCGRAAEEFVERMRSGDEEAFCAAFLRYSRPVLSFVYGILNDRDLAEEITQETFVRAYRNLGSFRQAASFSTWLFGVARNVAREAARTRSKEGRRGARDETASAGVRDPAAAADERLLAGELNLRIREALAALPEHYRVVFVLKIVNRLPYEEIAAITGAGIGKLKTDLHRARLEMRRKLAPFTRERDGGMRGGL